MAERMTDAEFEAMLRCKGYGDLDASLALNVEARRARAAESAALDDLARLRAENERKTKALEKALRWHHGIPAHGSARWQDLHAKVPFAKARECDCNLCIEVRAALSPEGAKP